MPKYKIKISLFFLFLIWANSSYIKAQDQVSLFRYITTLDSGVPISLSPNGEWLLGFQGEHYEVTYIGADGIQLESIKIPLSTIENININQVHEFALWSPDGQYIFFINGNSDSQLWLWGVTQKSIIYQWTLSNTYIADVAWTANSQGLVTNQTNQLEIFHIDGTRTTLAQNITLASVITDSVTTSPDGKYILGIGTDNIFLWDAQIFELIDWDQQLIDCHGGCSTPFAWSPNSRYLYMSTIGILDLETFQFIPQDAILPEYWELLSESAFSPNSEWLLSMSNGLYNIQTQQIITWNALPEFHNSEWRITGAIHWTPDSQYLIRGIGKIPQTYQQSHIAEQIQVWDWETQMVVESFQYDQIISTQMSPTNRFIIYTQNNDYQIHIYDYIGG